MVIEEVIKQFKDDLDFFDDELQKYDYIIDLGKKLEDISLSDKIDANLVQGCTSQVWLMCEKIGEKLYFRGTSDAVIVRGLVYIVLKIFSGRTKTEIANFNIDLLKDLNLAEIITPNRQSGVQGMIQKIKEISQDGKF